MLFIRREIATNYEVGIELSIFVDQQRKPDNENITIETIIEISFICENIKYSVE